MSMHDRAGLGKTPQSTTHRTTLLFAPRPRVCVAGVHTQLNMQRRAPATQQPEWASICSGSMLSFQGTGT